MVIRGLLVHSDLQQYRCDFGGIVDIQPCINVSIYHIAYVGQPDVGFPGQEAQNAPRRLGRKKPEPASTEQLRVPTTSVFSLLTLRASTHKILLLIVSLQCHGLGGFS